MAVSSQNTLKLACGNITAPQILVLEGAAEVP
jgi:hypothetical protein